MGKRSAPRVGRKSKASFSPRTSALAKQLKMLLHFGKGPFQHHHLWSAFIWNNQELRTRQHTHGRTDARTHTREHRLSKSKQAGSVNHKDGVIS